MRAPPGNDQLLNRSTMGERMVHLSMRVLPVLYPRPEVASLPQQIFFLLLVTTVQLGILPSLFGAHLYVDIVTPWLLAVFIFAPLPRMLPLCLIASLAIEQRTMAPIGLYAAAYWSAACTLYVCRNAFSWRHQTPWLVSTLAASLWIVVFEILVIFASSNPWRLDLEFFAVTLLRIGLSIGFGIVLYWDYMRRLRRLEAERS